MKNLKKTAAVLTAAAMMSMSMGMIAYAENPITTANGSDSKTVTGNYVPGGSAATRYKVDITWGNMEFTYTAAGEGSWNVDTHSYSGATDGSWSSESNTITLKNHSNTDVTAHLSFAGGTGFEGITAAFTDADTNSALIGDALTLESADQDEYRVEDSSEDNGYKTPTKSAKMTLSGDPAGSFTNGTTIGTVTVSIQ
ncbi:MAG: hypothetical protein Q4E24_07950 [bacterium]|nr:hypothetical protein [bacterium]